MSYNELPQVPPDDKGLYTYGKDLDTGEIEKAEVLIGKETVVPRTSKPYIPGGKISNHTGGVAKGRTQDKL